MSDPTILVAMASTGTAAIAMASAAALRGWQEWLDLRRIELGRRMAPRSASSRPDLAELRRRVRRLEAIADGSELRA